MKISTTRFLTTFFPLPALPALPAFLSFLALGVFSGCASHYAVKDPQTGTVYHTRDIERQRGGAVIFEDAKSKSEVTIQNSEVKKVSKSEYKSAIKRQPVE